MTQGLDGEQLVTSNLLGQRYPAPKWWQVAALDDVATILDSYREPINSKERQQRIDGKDTSQLFPYYGATGQVGYIDDYKLDGTYVLLGEDGAPFLEVDKAKAYIVEGKTWVNNHAHILAPKIDPYFFRYYLNTVDYTPVVTGTTRLKLNQRAMRKIAIAVPPLNEQRRIVAKIEELFSELDKGVESLKTARVQLKTYRQSLLKAAFEGRLTEQWRRDNADKLENAEQLLQRISAARDKHYSQQLKDWKVALEVWESEGKSGVKPKKPAIPKASQKSSTTTDLKELPEIPLGWKWIRLGDIALEAVLGKMLDKLKNKGTYKPYLRNINVRWGEFALDDILEMRFENHEAARYSLRDGDLVICEGGEPGRCAIWRSEYGDDMRIQKALHRVRFAPDCLAPQFVRYFVTYATGMFWLDRYMTGTTIKHLTGKGLWQVPIPVCSPQEQENISEILESRMSQIEELETVIAVNEQKLEVLRQSILKRAFEGKLVPQDPEDEPASVLLERICQEQASNPKLSRRKHKAGAAT